MRELAPREVLLKDIFNNIYRLDLISAIGKLSVDPPEIFHAQKLSRSLGIRHPVIGPELRFLERIGLIERSDYLDSTPAIWYKRNEDPLWEGFQHLQDIIDARFRLEQSRYHDAEE